MFEPNVARVLDLIGPSDLVLDIGGWARPFNRADYVIDAEPHATRGSFGNAQGGERELFTKNTWIQRDICDHTPFPFGDMTFDFVICSHTLEDVRDPVWVCAEMIRVAKRGYIEVPSRVAESCRGVEPGQVGWSHHRWLIDIADSSVTFLMKYHMIHSRARFSMPASYLSSRPERERVQWLFWEDQFTYRERTIHGIANIASELEGFVQRVHPYSRWRLRTEAASYASRIFLGRVLKKVGRVLSNG
jgi:hypothetical protein